MNDLSSRHPGTQHLMKLLHPNPNLTGDMACISAECWALADWMLGRTSDGPELTAGLRKLLEAKDCFVRQALVDSSQ